MNKKKIFLFIIFVISALILSSAIKTIIEGEKGKIKRVIFSAKRAIEKENLIRLSSYVSFDYQDKYGNDRQNILFLGRTVFNEYEDIVLQIKELNLELNGTEALAQVQVLGFARRSDDTQSKNPVEYDIIKLNVNFKKEKEGWKVIELEFLEPQKINFIPAA